MFAQLFLGLFFIIKGVVEHLARKPNLFVSEAQLNQEETYVKKVGKIHIVLGLIFVIMGQIEYRFQPESFIFISVYLVLGLSCLVTILFLNKKYTGYYILRS